MRRSSRTSAAGLRSRGGPGGFGWLMLLVAAAVLAAIGWQLWRQGGRTPPGRQDAARVPPGPKPLPVPPASAFRNVRFPTDQDILREPATPGVFQPTAAGNLQSALYGSVRSGQHGGRLMSQFHEGIDIAPVRRDGRGRPLDTVHAVAAGRVGYANRVPGNSNYGNYVVLLHDDPLGEIYTLYAHLADVDGAVRAGVPVALGTVLGHMGNTPATIIPAARAHMHFEVGLIGNAHFDRWFQAQRLKPDHGNYNGWNLLAVEPRGFFKAQRDARSFEFGSYLRSLPQAFEIVVAAHNLPDYFRRYPALWQGAPFAGGWLVLTCVDNGVPLGGRTASAEEIRRIGERKAVVLKADPAVLGRNGTRLVVQEGGAWRLGQSGERWLAILMQP